MDVSEAIKIRRSVRKYDSRPIESASYQKILQALRLAPSACNFQPWRFILVEDKDVKLALAKACKEQFWIADAPLVVVGCGYPKNSYQKMGGSDLSTDIDVSIALDHLTLAAVEEGLGTCWIGAFDQQKAKQLLQVPDEVKIVAIVPVGYPKDEGLIHEIDPQRRKGPAEVFSRNSFDGPFEE